MSLTLPEGYYVDPGPCPRCRRPLVRVDEVEGLPIYACPACPAGDAQPESSRDHWDLIAEDLGL